MIPMSDAGFTTIRTTLQVALDDLSSITPLLSEMTTEAEEAETKLKNIDVTPASFSSYPLAQSIASIHSAVAEVFTATTAGLVADTEAFSQALRDTLTEWDRVESAAMATFTSLATFANDREMASENAYDQSRHDHGDDLGREDEATEANASAADESLAEDRQAEQREACMRQRHLDFQ